MFFKETDIDIDYSIIMKNRVPLLIKDKTWTTLFGSVEEKSLMNSKRKLEELIEEQKRLDKELRRLKVQKKSIMDKILEVSHEINNKNDNCNIEILEECQNRLFKINEEIDELTYKSEILPKEIRNANFKLLKETVKYAYKELKDKNEQMKNINDSIESMRNELKQLLEAKYDYEEKVNKTYSFLHGVLGSREIEKLDREFL